MPNVPDLQPVAVDAGRSLVIRRKAELQPPPTNAVWTSDALTSYQLNAKCQDFVTRYLGRSLITPDDPNMAQVNAKLLELAFAVSFITSIISYHTEWKLDYPSRASLLTYGLQYPFLMHASLAVALTYDRHLNGSFGCRRTVEECYHWSQSTVLLNKRLREPIEAKDKDPIWGTAAALAVLSFSSPDACSPEEAWPLKSSHSDSSDLDWLRMLQGKMSLWHVANPLRPDSLFRVMAATFTHMYSPLPEKGIDGIPRALAAVCNLKVSSTADNNPYFHAAHAVSQTLNLPDIEVTTGQTQIFTRSIHGPFKDLLQKKDPAALLLLYLWYRKASRTIWWIELRARVECPSICSYLQIYHKGNGAVQAFLSGADCVTQGGVDWTPDNSEFTVSPYNITERMG